MQDKVTPAGYIRIRDLPYKGAGRILFEGHNVVTTVGKQRALELLGGIATGTVDQIVDTVVIGDNGVVQGPPRLLDVPVAASKADTALANEVNRKIATRAISLAVIPRLIYTASFLTNDSPSNMFFNMSESIINEAGLLVSDDDVLFARRTYPSIPFDVSDRLGVIIEWTVGML